MGHGTRLLCAVAVFLAISPQIQAAAPFDLSRFIGSTHWNPCYQNVALASLPSLHNGAVTLAETGTAAIKVALFQVGWMYPWNSTWDMGRLNTLVDVLRHPYFAALFSNTMPSPTNYSVFSLISYSCSGDASTGQACNVTNTPQGTNYWCANGGRFTPENATMETAQFHDAALHLLTTYAGTGRRFMFDNWEGDWSLLCGSYSRTQPVPASVSAAMVGWLTARQAGVSSARRAYCRANLANLNCATVAERDILAAAGVEVYMGAEVNLVAAALPPSPSPQGLTYMVRTVLPHVALDVVSYSSYDTMAGPQFADALDYIAAQHVPTSATPLDDSAVYVAEFGVAQMRNPLATVEAVTQNVVKVALSAGPGGKRRAAHVFWWELFCNEDNCRDGQPGRCNWKQQTNPNCLSGWWLMTPAGEKTWPFFYFQGLINGSIPVPAGSSGSIAQGALAAKLEERAWAA